MAYQQEQLPAELLEALGPSASAIGDGKIIGFIRQIWELLRGLGISIPEAIRIGRQALALFQNFTFEGLEELFKAIQDAMNDQIAAVAAEVKASGDTTVQPLAVDWFALFQLVMQIIAWFNSRKEQPA